MSSAFAKDIRRSITHSLGRFIAIAAITALGCGFYAGLRMTAPDMDVASDAYYDQTSLMDIRVVGSYGLTDGDVEALRNLDLVDQVMPAYETDVMANLGTEQYAMRVHSLNASALGSQPDGVGVASSDDGYLNRLVLVSGRWPEAPGECVIAADRVMNAPTAIGDKIAITQCTQDLEDTLEQTEYTIVGYVHSSYYVCSSSMGTTTLGSGSIQQYLFVSEGDFCDSLPYTEAFITVKGARSLQNASDEYKELIARATEQIEGISQERAEIRTQELVGEYQSALDEKWASYYSQKSTALSALGEAKSQIDDAATQLAEGQSTLDAKKSETEGQLEEGRKELEEQLAQARGQIEDKLAPMEELLDALKPYMTTRVYECARALLDGIEGKVWEEYEAEAQSAWSTYADAKAAAEQALAQADALIEGLREEYEAGLREYEQEYAQAMAQLDSAKVQLDDAQAQIDSMETGEWYVLDRTKNYGAEGYRSDARRVDNIAAVFPLIFFLVAALVSLTTMTRMVEEERVLIGTYKALGYSTGRVALKYLLYAAIAGVIGAVLGIAVLSQLLPWVIMGAYDIIYTVPATAYPINIPIAALSAGLGIGITLVATLAAVLASVREKPASLMLPKAPKAGKRILLERISPIWRRLSFSWKVTFRNLFRYRRRFIMTIIGIAGCTALLLTGWGLRDAINDIIDLHFGRVVLYNAGVTVEGDISDESRSELEQLLSDPQYSSGYTWIKSETMLVKQEGTSNVTVDMVVPQDATEFGDYVALRNRLSGEAYNLDDGGVVLTEKVANQLGLGLGDSVTLYGQDVIGNPTEESWTLTVTGLSENYVGNYVYVGAAQYESSWGEAPTFTKVLANATTDEALRDQLTEALRGIDGVKTVGYNDETISTYRTLLKSVDLIVWVLVVAAAALAFIVLYNLTNINITERIREIATLKVLGFTPGEVSAYIYRETALLSAIGALVGLFLGVFMESFVVTTAEVEQVMFGRDIHPESFLISFVLTLLFTVLVMLAMRRKLRRVNMVESLKSVE